MAKKYPGELVLLAVGPLQNVADALRLDPQLGKYLKRVVLMSGNIYGRAGGEKVIPEWNVVVATQDSQLVYGAGLPLTIVPLDSTTHVKLAGQRTRTGAQASISSHARGRKPLPSLAGGTTIANDPPRSARRCRSRSPG